MCQSNCDINKSFRYIVICEHRAAEKKRIRQLREDVAFLTQNPIVNPLHLQKCFSQRPKCYYALLSSSHAQIYIQQALLSHGIRELEKSEQTKVQQYRRVRQWLERKLTINGGGECLGRKDRREYMGI